MTPVGAFTAAEAGALADFLGAAERPQGTLSYCELAGFLFAVAASPEAALPSEWLPLIFDEQQAGYATAEEAQQILSLIMALYNDINRGVAEGAPALPPGCAARAKPAANLQADAPLSQWARGFTSGYDWLEDVWDAYVTEEFDEELGSDLLILSFFVSRELAEDYRKEMRRQDTSLDALAGEMLRAVPQAMHSYARIGRALADSAPG